MIAVLPVGAQNRLNKVFFLLSGNRMRILYPFYIVRLSVETTLLFILPIAISLILRNPIVADFVALIGVIFTFALMRSSAYEIKLDQLRDDREIRSIFLEHYKETHQNLILEGQG